MLVYFYNPSLSHSHPLPHRSFTLLSHFHSLLPVFFPTSLSLSVLQMMKMEISEVFSGSNDQQLIVKGKRTKRPRPSSSNSSIGGEFRSPSPTTSSGISTSTEEDEDMANCLILLARGISPPPQVERENKPSSENYKFSSGKFTEIMASTTAAAKVGIFVYECKTCNRTFPSFQALGGHRASHKKPKTATDDDRKKSPPRESGRDEGEKPVKVLITTVAHSTQIIATSDQSKLPKVHECSICGSEFGSGQALGGHMRRHRPAPVVSARIGLSTETDTSSHDGSEKPRSMLGLDLNLPAPPEDDKFHGGFAAKQQFLALVDCHY